LLSKGAIEGALFDSLRGPAGDEALSNRQIAVMSAFVRADRGPATKVKAMPLKRIDQIALCSYAGC
jgi:hypothetical protein